MKTWKEYKIAIGGWEEVEKATKERIFSVHNKGSKNYLIYGISTEAKTASEEVWKQFGKEFSMCVDTKKSDKEMREEAMKLYERIKPKLKKSNFQCDPEQQRKTESFAGKTE